jgi:hypothetical protein
VAVACRISVTVFVWSAQDVMWFLTGEFCSALVWTAACYNYLFSDFLFVYCLCVL